MKSHELKIFLSSTYLDLKEVREKIIKFLSVLNSDLINMEVFGSDESSPKEFCIQKLHEANFFIGIYAESYGTIDNYTGKSITELEYIEAYKKLIDHNLNGLLLYVLDPNSSWPIIYVDRDTERIDKMREFKTLISNRHTLSYFKDTNELPFNILSDVIRKLEIGHNTYFSPRKHNTIKFKDKLDRPVGMEFFNQELSNIFFGRENEIEELIKQILTYNFSLLIGLSGIGKTSLLNAGVIPQLNVLGWVCTVIRPLNDPLNNLKKSLWSQLMQGTLPIEFEIIDIVRAIASTYNGKKLLIIIDQFEDVLNCKSPTEIDLIESNLAHINSLNESNVHILISYRGDVESDIGKLWQTISGAADGLPRFYLKALNYTTSIQILQKSLTSLDINIEDMTFIKAVVEDLEIESLSNGNTGIFPPFLQMIIATIYENSKIGTFDSNTYRRLNGCKGIISNYLMHQLNYLGTKKEQGIKTLIALVSNYGTKTQKNVAEISVETQINKRSLTEILSDLLDLRLIRLIDNYYEITHDLLAKTILNSLITEEELNIRKFKFLLESKAAAYKSTNSGLTLIEHLYLYKYRTRITCTTDEINLMLNSRIENKTPIFYWLNKDNIDTDNVMLASLKDIDLVVYPYCMIKYVELPKYKDNESLEKLLILLSRNIKEEKVELFCSYAVEYAKALTLSDCYLLINAKQKWKRSIGLIGISTYGQKKDIISLKDIILIDPNFKIREIAFKSLISLMNRLKNYASLKDILLHYDGPYPEFILNDLYPEAKNNLSIDEVFEILDSKNPIDFGRSYQPRIKFLLKIVEKIGEAKDVKKIEKYVYDKLVIEKKRYEDYIPFLELALNFSCDFKYFVKIIQESHHILKINYLSNIHERIAALSSVYDYNLLRDIIVRDLKRNGENIKDSVIIGNVYNTPCKNYENSYFLEWIIGCAFCRHAKISDKKLLFFLLNHKLYAIKNAAMRTLYLLCNEDDLNTLISMNIDNANRPNSPYLGKNDNHPSSLMLLSLLDRKFYLNEELIISLDLKPYSKLTYVDSSKIYKAVPVNKFKYNSHINNIVDEFTEDIDLPF